MALELKPNSRFSISNVPQAAPGKCALCGSSGGDDRQFVDFGFQLDVYGAVYFCTFCMTELAQALGFSPSSEFQSTIDILEQEVSKVDDMYAEASRNYAAARTLLRNCNCHNNSSDIAVVESPSEDSESYDGEPVSPDDETAGADSEPDESSDVEGSDDVPNVGSDEEKPRAKSKRTNSSA